MSREVLFTGFAARNWNRGIVPIEIDLQDGYVNVWEDDNLQDDITDLKEFRYSYEETLFLSIEDFKRGISVNIKDVWPT